MKNNIITQKRCSSCGEFIDIAEFPFISKRFEKFKTGDWLRNKCNACTEISGIDAREKSRKKMSKSDHRHKYSYVESRVFLIDGLHQIKCYMCQTDKPLIDFPIRHDKRKGGETVTSRRGCCIRCYSKRSDFNETLRAIKKHFGVVSDEYIEMKQISQIGDIGKFKAIIKSLNVPKTRDNRRHPWRGKWETIKSENKKDFS